MTRVRRKRTVSSHLEQLIDEAGKTLSHNYWAWRWNLPITYFGHTYKTWEWQQAKAGLDDYRDTFGEAEEFVEYVKHGPVSEADAGGAASDNEYITNTEGDLIEILEGSGWRKQPMAEEIPMPLEFTHDDCLLYLSRIYNNRRQGLEVIHEHATLPPLTDDPVPQLLSFADENAESGLRFREQYGQTVTTVLVDGAGQLRINCENNVARHQLWREILFLRSNEL